MDLFGLMQNQVGLFLLIFARVSGIFSTAPIFGSRNVPAYLKAGMSLLFSFLLLPLVRPPAQPIPDVLFAYVIAVVEEFLLGLIFGFASSLVFQAVQAAGTLLDMQIGFGMVNVIDPQSSQQLPLLGNFKYILALLVFLAINGHHVLITALFSSFKLIPPLETVFRVSMSDQIVDMVGEFFVIAVKISLPVLAAVYLTDVALGILARTMPQMNIFVVGIPVKIAVGLFVLSLAIPFYVVFLEVVFNGMYRDVYHLLAVFAP
ncbi:type iii secretion system inner membrane r protein [Lucifera butyrica]|uniref:Flagellar biosynthetic protein FliR n=1 Tax=Lucifera butyrica TaxID=1351585 RepID=A0A498RAT8_9FIRM|nr:flagellar biosynthetic protein FliR [Lucifera butyrica]VBB08080.1 type iii secretion system inner membrane r protein [Lucifera butyrica]